MLIDADRIPRLERTLGRPRANQRLPMDLRVREVEAWLDLPGEERVFREVVWEPVTDSDTRGALETIARAL
jgi:hypothetical protein